VEKGETIQLAEDSGKRGIYLPKDDPDAAWEELQKLLGDEPEDDDEDE
jgi:hypothetical protein